MSILILVTYATRYGSTQEVAEAVAATLREEGLEVELQPIQKVRSLERYSGVVLGAPLFMFHWHKEALGFLSRYRQALIMLPVAVFALGPVHDPHDEQEWKNSQEQLDQELAKFPWFRPVTIQMFGGKYDPERLSFPIKAMAGKTPATDIRDWQAIRAWAGDMGRRFQAPPE